MSLLNPKSRSSDAILRGVISAQPSLSAVFLSNRWGRDMHPVALSATKGGFSCRPSQWILGLNLPAFFPRMTWLRISFRVFGSGLARDVVMMNGAGPDSAGLVSMLGRCRGRKLNELSVADGMARIFVGSPRELAQSRQPGEMR